MGFCWLLLLVHHGGCTSTSWKQTNNSEKQPQTNSICQIPVVKGFFIQSLKAAVSVQRCPKAWKPPITGKCKHYAY